MAEARPRPDAPADACGPLAPALRAIHPRGAAFADRLHCLVRAAPALELLRGCHRREGDGGLSVFSDPRGLLWNPMGDEGATGDLDAQMALLAGHEAALDALERAIGTGFAPDRVIEEWPADTVWIVVRHGDRRFAFGFLPHRIDADGLRGEETVLAPARVPVAVRPTIRAARLAIADVEGLSPGALLCLPGAPFAIALEAANAPRALPGWWNPHDGICNRRIEEGASPMADTASDGSPVALHVPVSVRLPERSVQAAAIESLAEGGTVALGPLDEGLQAELLVSGQPIAMGEIVRLGDGFAFLVDHMARPVAQEPPPAPHRESE